MKGGVDEEDAFSAAGRGGVEQNRGYRRSPELCRRTVRCSFLQEEQAVAESVPKRLEGGFAH